MKWYLKSFEELTTKELYEILKIRVDVFVVEQNCPYEEVDSKDEKAHHLFAIENDKLVAYLRILDKGVSYDEISIGRVLVHKDFRKNKLGNEMMLKAIDYITNTIKDDKIRISAQAYLLDFYRNLGFKEVSEIYLEDNIPHIEMLYTK